LEEMNSYSFSGGIGINDNSTVATSDGNFAICGNNSDEITVLKINKEGKELWRNDFSIFNSDEISSIAESINGDIFLCGDTKRNSSNPKSKILIVKLNSIGDTIWSKTYGGENNDFGKNIISTSDGNILFSAKTESFGATSFGDIYLAKINTDGDTLWTNTYPDQDQEIPFHLLETQNNQYLITGTNQDSSSPREVYLLRVNENGEQLWDKKIGPATNKWGLCSIELSNGNLMTCGYSTDNGKSKLLVINTNNVGDINWEREYNHENISVRGESMVENEDNSITILGNLQDNVEMEFGAIILKINSSGDEISWNNLTNPTDANGSNILKEGSNCNFVTGLAQEFLFMSRIDNEGKVK